MRGDERDAACEAAVRDRDAERRRHADAGSDARNHLDLDASGDESLHFLAAAPEDERITALETGHHLPLPGVEDHQALDELLRRRCAAAALADFDHARVGACVGEAAAAHQLVDQDDIRHAEHARGLQRHQFRVARTCSDQVDLAAAHAAKRASSSRKSPRPRARDTPFQKSTGLRSTSGVGRSSAAFGWRRSYTNSESDS